MSIGSWITVLKRCFAACRPFLIANPVADIVLRGSGIGFVMAGGRYLVRTDSVNAVDRRQPDVYRGGEVRQHYRRYLQSARRGEVGASQEMAAELALIQGLPVGVGEKSVCRNCRTPCCGLISAFIWPRCSGLSSRALMVPPPWPAMRFTRPADLAGAPPYAAGARAVRG